MIVPTEAQEAQTLVQWLRVRGYKFHHSPNETGRDPYARRRAIRVKREGTSKGFPDYVIVKPTELVVIELKRIKGSTTSSEQTQWVAALDAVPGVRAAVCKGAEAAINFIEGGER